MGKESGAEKAKKLLNRYGGEVDDYFKFWPADKDFFFASDNKAFLAYRVKHRVAVCAFDPVGPADSVAKLTDEFSEFCKQNCWRIIFIQTTDKSDKIFSNAGLRRVIIGCDCVIVTKDFVDKTVHNKYFRNIVNRFNKRGFVARRHLPPHNKELITELKSVSDDWLKMPHHEEWQFLTGRFDTDYLKDCPLFVLRDKTNRAQAFVTELPSFKKDVGSIDLIRHRRDALPNSIDFLLIELIRQLKRDNVKYFNLGLSPLAGQLFAKNWVEKVIVWFYKTFQSFMRFKGLQQFKAKFQPEWEPRYIYIDKNLWNLPRMGLAIIQLMGRYKPKPGSTNESVKLADEPAEQKV